LGGRSPKKYRRPKTCKISVDFLQRRILIAKISGTAKDIQIKKGCFLGRFLLRSKK